MAKKVADGKDGGWKDSAAEKFWGCTEAILNLNNAKMEPINLGDLISEMIVLQAINPKIRELNYQGRDRERYEEIKSMINNIGYDAMRNQPERFVG